MGSLYEFIVASEIFSFSFVRLLGFVKFFDLALFCLLCFRHFSCTAHVLGLYPYVLNNFPLLISKKKRKEKKLKLPCIEDVKHVWFFVASM
jgi:hypothetical protein